MKKLILVLGVITCILGMTACGVKEAKTSITPQGNAFTTEADLFMAIDNMIAEMNIIVEENGYIEAEAGSAILEWKAALEDIGGYVSVEEKSANIDSETAVIQYKIKGTERTADLEIIVSQAGYITEFSVTPISTFGELMTRAALNTVLGMGTVFAVLILISLIISCFKFIPKLQAVFTKKQSNIESVDHAIAQIIKNEELAEDDLELVAVISAAIAASEGKTSTDGFSVRSIRRANTNKWKRA